MRVMGTVLALAVSLLAASALGVRTGWWPGWAEAAKRYLGAAAEPLEELGRDPANPYRWCGAAEVLADAGQTDKSLYCSKVAEELGPHAPAVLMRVANYHLASGDMREALRRTSRVLGLAGDYDAIIFHYYRRFEVPVEAALETGLPAEERAWRAYFEDLLRWAKVEQAELAWGVIIRNSFNNDALAIKFLEYLISSRAYDKAVAVWAGQLGERRGDYPGRNLLYNGGFEQEFTGARLDWRVRTAAGVEVRRDQEVRREGAASLRIGFGGEENLDYRHVEQLTVAPPGSYLFRAWVRTEGLTTDQGVYFQIGGTRTEALTGTNDWTPLEARFRAEGGTVAVRLCRDASRKIDSRLRGTVWIDTARIERVR